MGKILIYPLTDTVGGVEEYEMNLIRYSPQKIADGYGYVVLGDKSPYVNELTGHDVHYFILPKKEKLIKSVIGTYKLFGSLRGEYDTLYFNTSAIGYIVPYLCAIHFKYRIALHSHLDGTYISSQFKKIVQRINYQIIKKHISVKLACSMSAAKWLFCGDMDSVHIIPNAIDLQRFKFDNDVRKQIRQDMCIEDSIVIGNVSRLTEVKNQNFLIDLVNEMLKHGDDVKLLLVGDGEDKESLVKRVEEYGIQEKVIFYGRTSTPERIMNAMDCIVLPSLTEGFPISIIEAQAAGLKCILSDTVTKEVNVTGDVTYLSLGDPLAKWEDEILKLNYARSDNYETLEKRGFDVNGLEAYVSQVISE